MALHGRSETDVVLYEQEPRAGGHAHTIEIDYLGTPIAVDTGFIVYNQLNYPNLTALLDWAGVSTIASDMSFSLSSDGGAFEWCGRHTNPLGGLFAQWHNALRPGFYRFLLGIRAFQKRAISDATAGEIGAETLSDYLDRIGCPRRVRDDYVVPMGAAIWSMTPGETLAFPARSFMAFFLNHRLLQWDRPRWRTVQGGSRCYVDALMSRLGAAVRTGVAARSVRRNVDTVLIEDSTGIIERYDSAVLATHAPTSLTLLTDADPETHAVLGAFRVSHNRVVVHRDPALMPKRRQAWASWNLLRQAGSGQAAVTYWMNRLQSIPDHCPLFVTLNPDRPIRDDLVFASFDYDHPIFDGPAIAAQSRLTGIQGRGNVFFAGAWTGYGFHEDGLRSGLATAAMLGGLAPWLR